MLKNDFVKGSLILAIGIFISKGLGAIYRIPLLNLIGAKGMGLYQMVFPVYCVMLDFAGMGVPSALSKIISSNNKSEVDKVKIIKTSKHLLSIFGIICSFIMALGSYLFSILQGNSQATLGYIFLAPAVFLVAIISCYRGYFQGKFNMKPTAISQIIEQSFKLFFGLLFVYLLRDNVSFAVGGATFAVTISEVIALIYLWTKYRKVTKSLSLPIIMEKEEEKKIKKEIIKLTIPITLTGIIIPISQVIDSFMIVNMLKVNFSNATELYGLYSGTALTIINLPISLLYSISEVTISSVSSANLEVREQKIKKSLIYTLILSIPMAIAIFMFSPVIVNVVYSSLSDENLNIVNKLIRIMSVNIVLLSILQTLNSCLIGKDKIYTPTITLSIGVIIKIIFNAVLLQNKNIGIYGVCFSLIACYFVTCLLNLIIVAFSKVKYASKKIDNRQLSN